MDLANLNQRWIHSHEEDSGGDMVLRPASYKFPPSRGRFGFEMQSSGKVLTTGPSPSDKVQFADGEWKMTGEDTLVLESKDGGLQRFQLVDLQPDKLVVRPLTPTAGSR